MKAVESSRRTIQKGPKGIMDKEGYPERGVRGLKEKETRTSSQKADETAKQGPYPLLPGRGSSYCPLRGFHHADNQGPCFSHSSLF